MASADELRQAIATNRQALRAAIEATAGKWEVGDEDNWGPRRVAEHCIGAEFTFAGMVAKAIQSKAPDSSELSFASSAEATSGLDAAAAASDNVFSYIEDHDLVKAAPMPDGVPFGKNIEGVLNLAAWHLNDHAGQLGKA